jgi:ABC-type spermidine/putrescine transport system permease subunit I
MSVAGRTALPARGLDRPRRRLSGLRRGATIMALLTPGLLLLGLVLVWPFFVMLGLSVRERWPGPFVFTLAKYAEFLGDEYLLRVALRTLLLGLATTTICAVLAYPVAWFLARSNSRWKHLVFLGTIFWSSSAPSSLCWSASSSAPWAGPSCSARRGW